jgi:hypothetical protein
MEIQLDGQSVFFWQGLFVVFHVTLDYRIDFCIRGSNYNIFAIKTFYAVMNVVIIQLD